MILTPETAPDAAILPAAPGAGTALPSGLTATRLPAPMAAAVPGSLLAALLFFRR